MTGLAERREDLSYQCPVCDVTLTAEPALPTYDAPCPDCGYGLWCRKRKVDDVVVLSVLPDRTPELADIKRLTESLVRSCRVLRVVVDLSDLNFVNSAMMARLISLRRRVLAAKGRLVLCGLSPHVETVFSRTRIDSLFEIRDTSTDALSELSSRTGSRREHAMKVESPQVAVDDAKRNRPPRIQHGKSPTEKKMHGGRASCSSFTRGTGAVTESAAVRAFGALRPEP